MPRGTTISVENNFTQGLITEFTAMNFPENAVTDADNCVFSELGAVTRRLGMEYENEFVLHDLSDLSPNYEVFVESKWHSVAEVGTTSFVVQQIGQTIRFFTVDEDAALSQGLKSFSIDLADFVVAGADPTLILTTPCQFTTARGYLVVVHPICEPFYVAYTAATDTIATTVIDVEVRDFEGLDDGLDVDVRPSTLSDTHKYNLYNQGWSATTKTDDGDKQALQWWIDNASDYPANSDIFWLFRDLEGRLADGQINTKYIGNTPAPTGHYIYDAFNIDRTAKTGIPGLTADTSGAARPSCVAFYAGRAFYAGVGADRFSDKIYFSQIIDADLKFGKAHQQNDPTSEITFDLLDNDGGVISLPLVEKIVAMKVVADVLVILCTNGVWTVSGTANGPFKATDYTTSYVSSIGVTSHLSIVEVDGGLTWWNNDGIYALGRDNIGNFSVQNLSKSTIQTVFNNIPSNNLKFIKAAYNKKDQLVQWLYADTDDLTGYRYNRVMEFNVISKAFYPFSLPIEAPVVSGIITIGGQKKVIRLQDVTDNSLVTVTDNALEDVEVGAITFAPNSELFKYAVINEIDETFSYSEFWDDSLQDFVSEGGFSYSSYCITGYRVRGEFLRSTQSSPILFVLEQLDEGRLLVSGIWDYGFRQGSSQELYITRPEVTYLMRRIKLFGKGRASQLKFQSVEDYPFTLVGWSSLDSGGQNP